MVAGFVVCELAQFLRVTGEGAHRRDPRINLSDQLVITVDYPSRVCVSVGLAILSRYCVISYPQECPQL